MNIMAPYLIQRAGIVPNAPEDATVSKALRLEYMGKAEFEFGALPKSLRMLAARACKNEGILVPQEMTGVVDREGRTMLVVGIPEGQVEEYLTAMQPVIDDTKRIATYTDIRDAMLPLAELPAYHPLNSKPPAGKRRGAARDEYLQDVQDRMTKVWWDIDNHALMSFEAPLMERLAGHLRVSWASMDPVPDYPAAPANKPSGP